MSSDQQHPYDPYGQGQSHQSHQNHQDPGVAQTWEGQTWDTHYQPVVQPAPQAHAPAEPGQPGHGPAESQPGYPPSEPVHLGYVPAEPGQPEQGQAAPGPHGQQVPPPAQASLPHPPHPQSPHSQDPYAAHQQDPYASAPYTSAAAAAETAYLPKGTPSGSYPLPPEVPVAAMTYEPQQTAHQPQTSAEPTYSAPTTMGNARITDAQRARAEGRSPIIPPGIQPAGLTAVIGLVLAGAAAASPYLLLGPLVLLQALTAAGWFRLNGMWPARQGIALAFAGGIAADAVLLATGRDHAPAALIGTLGVWVLLTLVLQLRSHAGADERMYGLMATVASAALTIVAAGYLAAAPDAVTVGGAAVAVAVLVRALPLPGPASIGAALLAAAAAGYLVGHIAGTGAAGSALLALGAGACALVGLHVASYDYPSRFVHMTAGIALPLTVAAPVVYLLGRALV